MNPRTRVFVCIVVAGAGACLYSAHRYPGAQWIHFSVYLAAILLSSGMKVAMPKSDATMSVNFPFVLLGIVQLSPLQAVALVAASVITQCRIRVTRRFTRVQIVFNVANATIATVLACEAFRWSMGFVDRKTGPALAIAVTVYFLINTLCLAVVLASESGISPFRAWYQEFPWYFPFYLAGAGLAAIADFIGNQFGWLTSMLLIPMVYAVYSAYRAQTAVLRDREQHITEIEELQLRTIEGLAMAIEAKDQNTHRHLMRVRVYVSELGTMIGLKPIEMQALVAASYLHDIGKLAVPEHIINKPGKLTPAEFERIKIHPVVGADILERVRFPYPVVPIVRSHHEAWDGSGYPDGLKGEEIPIGARILTAVDCFDALASERPYRKALPLNEAMGMVKSMAGKQLDPEIVKLLELHCEALEKRARQAIEEVAPLNTDHFIERGRAPGAGFEPDRDGSEREENFFNAMGSLGGFQATVANELAAFSTRLSAIIPSDCFAIYRKSGAALLREFIGGAHESAISTNPIRIGEGLSGWVAEYGLPVLNGNPTVEPNLAVSTHLFSADSSAISTPILDGNGSVLGVITLYSREHAAYRKGQLTLLSKMAAELVCLLKIERSSQGTAENAPALAGRECRPSDSLAPLP